MLRSAVVDQTALFYSYGYSDIGMGSKNIAIRDEAVEILDALKREDESYSDVIVRIGKNDADVRDLRGMWKETDKAERARRAVESSRESIGATRDERTR